MIRRCVVCGDVFSRMITMWAGGGLLYDVPYGVAARPDLSSELRVDTCKECLEREEAIDCEGE